MAGAITGLPARTSPDRSPNQLSGMVVLTADTLRAAFSSPASWTDEFVVQSAIVARRCLLPLAISAAAFAFGVGVILAASTLGLLGAADRLGGGLAIGSTREFATWITGMLVAGIAGTAMCSDLGARKVREELDALGVLGIDPIRHLVVPRFLALAVMTPLLYLWTAFVGNVVGAVGAALLHGVPLASYIASFSTLVPVDIFAALIKLSLFGVLTAVVFCFKGMNVRGGPAGVGREVNQAVVIVFATIWIFNFLFNSFYLAAFPETGSLR